MISVKPFLPQHHHQPPVHTFRRLLEPARGGGRAEGEASKDVLFPSCSAGSSSGPEALMSARDSPRRFSRWPSSQRSPRKATLGPQPSSAALPGSFPAYLHCLEAGQAGCAPPPPIPLSPHSCLDTLLCVSLSIRDEIYFLSLPLGYVSLVPVSFRHKL